MHIMSQTEKDRITSLLSHKLNNDERAIFAYIYDFVIDILDKGTIEKFMSGIET